MNQIEGVISIKDLFAELVRKCWIIIICTIAGVIALGGYKLVNDLQAQKNVDEVIGELTEEEIEAADDYILKMCQKQELEAYIDDSILLNINPYNTYRVELQFVITSVEIPEDLSTIRAAYADYALFGRLAKDISEKYEKYEELALHDVIDTDGDIREQDPDLRSVRIMIFAQSVNQAEELAGYVKNQMGEYAKELKQTLGEHNFELADENTLHYLKEDLIGKKDYYKEQLEKLETEVEMLADQLSSSQMSYVLEIIGDDAKNPEEEVAPEKQTVGLKSIIKFAALGGVLGFAGGVVLVVVLYFFSNQIKSEKEIEYIHEIPHLGNLDEEEITKNIVAVCKDKSISKLTFVGVTDEKVKETVHGIVEELGKYQIIATIHKWNESKEVDAEQSVVFVETIRKTTYEDVKEQLRFCSEQNLNICGYITFL